LRWCAFAAVIGAAGVFAGFQFAPEPAIVEAFEPITYTVVSGSVSHDLRFEAEGFWPLMPWALAPVSGVVTTIDVPESGYLEEGKQILSVGLRPLIALIGEVPVSRDLTIGSVGPDVQQLEQFLVNAGFLGEANETFDAATGRAVRDWKRQAGITPADGIVHLGDIVFFPELPTQVAISSNVAVGAAINVGQALVDAVTGEPIVEIVTGAEQASLIPQDGDLSVSIGDYTWPALFQPSFSDENNLVHIPITAPDGTAVCGADCPNALPIGRTTRIAVHIIQVPLTEGPVVPTAALRTDPAGEVAVTDVMGQLIPVTLRAAHGGLAVIDGIPIGTEILVFGS